MKNYIIFFFFIYVEKDIRDKSVQWLRHQIDNTKAFTKFSIDVVKNVEPRERPNIDLPAVPDRDIGFCPACYDIDQGSSIWDTSGRRKEAFNKHCKVSDHKFVRIAKHTCNICGSTFKKREDLEKHPCQQPFDHDDFVRYAMLDDQSRMYKMLVKLPELDLINCVFEERVVLKHVWPPLSIKGGARSQKNVDYSDFGNVHGKDFIEKALKQKIEYNQENSLILDKNIRVINEQSAERIFDLGPQYTKPTSPIFNVKEIPGNKWEVSLVNPPKPKKAAPHSASVTQLIGTFYGDEGARMEEEEEDDPKLYPNLDKLCPLGQAFRYFP